MHTEIVAEALAFAMLVVPSTHLAAKRENLKATSVCQLLGDPEHLDGHLVSVRGILRTIGGDEGAAPYFDELVGIKCLGQSSGEMKLQLVSPDTHFLANPPSGYKPDQRSIKRAEDLFNKALSAGYSTQQFEATVEGIFYRARNRPDHRVKHRQYSGYVIIQAIRSLRALP